MSEAQRDEIPPGTLYMLILKTPLWGGANSKAIRSPMRFSGSPKVFCMSRRARCVRRCGECWWRGRGSRR